jgi:hypothetical protein
LLKSLHCVDAKPAAALRLSPRSIARYGLAIASEIEKNTALVTENAVSASIMFDEASDIQMHKKLNIFVNVSHIIVVYNFDYSIHVRTGCNV